MVFFNKIFFSAFYFLLFSCSAYSGDLDDIDRRAPPTIELARVNGKQVPLRTIDLEDLSTDSNEHKQRSDEETSTGSFASTLYGNQDIKYSNWCLECYAKKSSTCWNFIHSVLGDLDGVSHAAETALTVCTQYVKGDIAVYVIQVAMLADTLRQLYSLSQKIAPIRASQAYKYGKQNEINAIERQNPNRPLLIDDKEISEDTDYYVSRNTACFYDCCATFRNIAWEQMGIISILCRVLGNSIVAFSLSNKSETLLFAATLLRIGGAFCHLYARSLSRNTKEMERLAINAKNFIEYTEREKAAKKSARVIEPNTPEHAVDIV